MALPSVYFRGPMLTVVRKDGVNVLIPNAQRTLPGNRHIDRSEPVRPHIAGMLKVHYDGTNTATFRDGPIMFTSGVDVSVDDHTSKSCAFQAQTYKKAIDLRKLTDCPGLELRVGDPSTLLAATVILNGGELRKTSDETALTYNFEMWAACDSTPKPRKIPYLTQWTARSDNVTISFSDDLHEDVVLGVDEAAFIFQWDGKTSADAPEAGKYLEHPIQKCPANHKVLEDIDFKWVYQLLSPLGIDWDEWLQGQQLPAPIADCSTAPSVAVANARTPGGSDCLDAVWIEDGKQR